MTAISAAGGFALFLVAYELINYSRNNNQENKTDYNSCDITF